MRRLVLVAVMLVGACGDAGGDAVGACGDVFAEGVTITAGLMDQPCADGGGLLYSGWAFLDCADGRRLVWSDMGWGYVGEGLRHHTGGDLVAPAAEREGC